MDDVEPYLPDDVRVVGSGEVKYSETEPWAVYLAVVDERGEAPGAFAGRWREAVDDVGLSAVEGDGGLLLAFEAPDMSITVDPQSEWCSPRSEEWMCGYFEGVAVGERAYGVRALSTPSNDVRP